MPLTHAPCPFCQLSDGFHDEDWHDAHDVARMRELGLSHLLMPSHSEVRRELALTKPRGKPSEEEIARRRAAKQALRAEASHA